MKLKSWGKHEKEGKVGNAVLCKLKRPLAFGLSDPSRPSKLGNFPRGSAVLRTKASLVWTCSEEAGLAGSIPAHNNILARVERPHHRLLAVRLEALYDDELDVHFLAFSKYSGRMK